MHEFNDLVPAIIRKTVDAWGGLSTREAQRQLLRGVCRAWARAEKPSFSSRPFRVVYPMHLLSAVAPMGDNVAILSWFCGDGLSCARQYEKLYVWGSKARLAGLYTEGYMRDLVLANDLEWIARITSGQASRRTMLCVRLGTIMGCIDWICGPSIDDRPDSYNFCASALGLAVWEGRPEMVMELVKPLAHLAKDTAEQRISEAINMTSVPLLDTEHFSASVRLRSTEIQQCLDWLSCRFGSSVCGFLARLVGLMLPNTAIKIEQDASGLRPNQVDVGPLPSCCSCLLAFVFGATGLPPLWPVLLLAKSRTCSVQVHHLFHGALHSGSAYAIQQLGESTFAASRNMENLMIDYGPIIFARDRAEVFAAMHKYWGPHNLNWNYTYDSVPTSAIMVDAVLQTGCNPASLLTRMQRTPTRTPDALRHCLLRVADSDRFALEQ